MKNLIFLALFMGACGTDDAEDSSLTSEKPALQSVMLNSKKDLPDCGKVNDKQLAYVIDEKQFYTCDGDWLAIDISPEAIAGIDGKDGADGATVTTNNWFDAVTGKNWLIGPAGIYATFASTCSGIWRMPSKDEALAAAQRGVGLAAADISGPTTMWSTDVWPSNATYNWSVQAINTVPVIFQASRTDGTTTKGVFCIEE